MANSPSKPAAATLNAPGSESGAPIKTMSRKPLSTRHSTQDPRQRGAAASFEHYGDHGGGHPCQQEHRYREEPRKDTLLVGHNCHERDHETAGELRYEQPENQHREAVDEPGGEAQQRRDDCRHALLRRNEELAHVRHISFDLMFCSFPRERESRSGLLRDRLSLEVTAFAGTSGGGVTA